MQELAWRKAIQVLDERGSRSAPRSNALFPEDCCEPVLPNETIIQSPPRIELDRNSFLDENALCTRFVTT